MSLGQNSFEKTIFPSNELHPVKHSYCMDLVGWTIILTLIKLFFLCIKYHKKIN